mmetsp:Transcript_59015/g.163246  ORF Transcript_59015/g.163246 Transcript_59015/m.163246 type:complete len:89 (+) Transcript_59015:3-269(+)
MRECGIEFQQGLIEVSDDEADEDDEEVEEGHVSNQEQPEADEDDEEGEEGHAGCVPEGSCALHWVPPDSKSDCEDGCNDDSGEDEDEV